MASKTKEQNDFSAGFWLAAGPKGYYVGRRRVKEKMEYPQAKRRIVTTFDADPADAVVIEDASAGQAVIQDLRQTTNLPIVAVTVDKDKVQRLNIVAPSVEAGNWHLPEGEAWVEDFMENVAAFPNVAHDDDVDSWSMGAAWIMGKTQSGVNLTFG
jgi:predicted phage terminase large subunit-like protein